MNKNTKKSSNINTHIVYASIIIVLIFMFISSFQIVLNLSNKRFQESNTNTDAETFSVTNSNDKSNVVVHIKGEVENPGIYKISPNSRVTDAIETAGGFTENADRDSVNLAALVKDGDEIKVKEREVPKASSDSAVSTKNEYHIVNINTASVEELTTLPGIGPILAREIIKFRNSYGGFSSVEDIVKVKGFGTNLYLNLKAYLTV